MINMTPAFVLKNYIPMSHKVEILHREYGKIVCIYPRNHQAAQLSAGSLIFCIVEKNKNFYKFLYLEIESSLQGFCIQDLEFVHDFIRLCLKRIPREIKVPELFDFWLYIYNDLKNLSDNGKLVVLLRCFLMLDLLPEQSELYTIATQDPYGIIQQESKILHDYVRKSWENFYQYDAL
ncbi:MAG TPA: hypothetical protein VLG50_02070 [Candidatus Saccharimonadales bacterium]|nr:hypothetical protein [Candidatus Saccharimonadales bacterium]